MIGWNELFNLENDKELRDAIKLIEKFDKVYDKFIGGTKELKDKYVKNIRSIVKATESLSNAIKKINVSTQEGQSQLAKLSKTADIAAKQYETLKSKVNSLEKSIDKLEKEQKQYNERAKEAIKLSKEEERLTAKLASLDTTRAKEVAKLKIQIQERNKALKQAAKESLGLISIYQKESKRLIELRNKYKNAALQYGENSKEARRYLKELTALDKLLKRIGANVGEHQRNVGNYAKAWAGVKRVLTAAGFTSGLYFIVSIFRDAFNVIKQFDAEMTNMAAIVGKTRKQLKSVEDQIRQVARTSINTANEVAKTATALFTLGKTESEVRLLLDPVNSLSIALQAPADAAGELLIQTLNAFGESSDAAQKYADIIAKMRTSTALDFERIKDALGFLAPTAKAAGISFEQTGAILGTLVDSGIKAARAGRLMSSSFLKLADDGLTLDQALAELRETQEQTDNEQILLSKSSQLFGKEAAALGLILAENIDKVNEYTASFENAAGSLNELTQNQLASLENKMKLLRSAWDDLILSVEKGDSILGKLFGGLVDSITFIISNVKLLGAAGIPGFAILADLLEADPTRIEQAMNVIRKTTREVSDAKLFEDQSFWTEKIWKNLVNAGFSIKEAGAITAMWRDSLVDVSKEVEEEEKATKRIVDLREKLLAIGLKRNTDDPYSVLISGKPNILDQSKLPTLSPQFDQEEFKKATDEAFENLEEYLDHVEEIEKAHYQNRLEEFNKFKKQVYLDGLLQVLNASLGLSQAFSDRKIEQYENQINTIQEQRERDLELAGNNEDAKNAINERADKQQEELRKKQNAARRKQSIKEKALRIVETIVNTAAAIMRAFAELGPIAGIPAAALIGATGAIQVATIAAQPIPQFAKGTDNAPGGLAVVGEKGREIVHEPSGRTYITGDKAELRDVPEGSQILTNVITERILSGRQKEINDDSTREVMSAVRADRINDNIQIAKLIAGNELDISPIVRAIKENKPPDYYMVGSTLYKHKKVSEDMVLKIRQSVLG